MFYVLSPRTMGQCAPAPVGCCRQLLPTIDMECLLPRAGSLPRARDEKGPAKLQARFCVPVQFVIRNSTVFNQVNLSPPFASLQFTIAI